MLQRPKADGRWVARRDADRRFEALFESAGEALALCDANGLVVGVNTAAAGLLEQSPGALRGQPLSRWLQQPQIPAGRRGELGFRDGDAELRRACGPPQPVELRVSRLPLCLPTLADQDAPAQGEWLLCIRDYGDRRKAQAHLSCLANYDSLTGLPNRALFRDRLAQAMARADRSGRQLALMFMDLDHFKVVNDGLGHEVGDALLKHVAKVLTASLREGDSVSRLTEVEPFTLSRLGGDEFTVIAENIGGAEEAAMVARRLLEALQAPFYVNEGLPEMQEVVVSSSIGISMYPTDKVDLDGLIRHTDMAMYRSKSLGRGMYSFFSDDLNAAVTARLSLETALRRATEKLKDSSLEQEFSLHFQPKCNLRTDEVTGVEALLRWHCPGKGMVPPDRFIGVLEDTGMILPVGAWVIRAACAQMHAWDLRGLPPLQMAVNLSARQVRHNFLASMISDTLRENDIEPQRLEIELTESLLAEDKEGTRTMLESFARIGVRLAIDDFGTGESSLSRMQHFKIDTLKIDRAFVKSLQTNAGDVALSTAVIALARALSIGKVVAEGVELQAQAQILRHLGCDEMQGYLLSRPLPPDDLATWLLERLHKQNEAGRFTGAVQGAPLQRLSIETTAESGAGR
jgi:diguanylate cyclase (GGDEF)-like protein